MISERFFRLVLLSCIYLAFVVMFAYLFLFNAAFEIVEEYDSFSGEKQFFLKNNTNRLINNVSLTFLDARLGRELKSEVVSLGPKDKLRLDLSGFSATEIRIVAYADFYAKVEKSVFRVVERPYIRTDFPKSVFFGQRFTFMLEYCNTANYELPVKIEESHDRIFFLERNEVKSLVLKPGECKEFNFSFLPAFRGQTKIYFNVQTPLGIERLEESVRVE
ncbi:MAG: hypothetical protein QXU92_00770 [Candidatus Diapherotrites archaeon]